MAIVRFGGFNEGSLLRRTLLHVASFVVGSLAFVTIVSFVLVTVAKGILPQRGGSKADKDKGDETATAADADDTASPATPGKPAPRPRKTPRRGAAAAAAPPQAADE